MNIELSQKSCFLYNQDALKIISNQPGLHMYFYDNDKGYFSLQKDIQRDGSNKNENSVINYPHVVLNL